MFLLIVGFLMHCVLVLVLLWENGILLLVLVSVSCLLVELVVCLLLLCGLIIVGFFLWGYGAVAVLVLLGD